MIRVFDAPTTRAASTNSRSRIDNVAPRTTRAIEPQSSSDRISVMPSGPPRSSEPNGPRSTVPIDTATARIGNAGSAIQRSVKRMSSRRANRGRSRRARRSRHRSRSTAPRRRTRRGARSAHRGGPATGNRARAGRCRTSGPTTGGWLGSGQVLVGRARRQPHEHEAGERHEDEKCSPTMRGRGDGTGADQPPRRLHRCGGFVRQRAPGRSPRRACARTRRRCACSRRHHLGIAAATRARRRRITDRDRAPRTRCRPRG